VRGRATLFWIGLAAAVGFGLFHVKYKVQALEDELTQLNSQIVHEQEQVHVLRAEWAYLNRPERLEELNGRFLGLGPMTPVQLGGLDDLPPRPPVEDTEDAPTDGGAR
jgi:hypothetical protein